MGADLKNVTPGCLCVILFSPPPQRPHQRPGLGPDGAADEEAEPPRRGPHPALVRARTQTPTTRARVATLHEG